MGDIKHRLVKLAEFKGVSKREFCRKIDVSPTFLVKEGDISSAVLLKIVTVYPDIDFMWLLNGEGEMLKGEASENIAVGEKNENLQQQIEKLIETNAKLVEMNAKLTEELLSKRGTGPAGEAAECAGVESVG